MYIETIEAKFVSEGHNRFISLIEIEGNTVECYVPSSAKMSNFLNLINKEILVTPNIDKTRRTKYSLFAVKYYHKYILLNLNSVNKLLMNYLVELYPNLEITLEKSISGYKSDVIINHSSKSTTLIEAKGIISIRKECIFPSKESARAIFQLEKIKNLLHTTNIEVIYYLVNLGPITKFITIENSNSEYVKLLRSCINMGMVIKALTIEYTGSDIKYKPLAIKFK